MKIWSERLKVNKIFSGSNPLSRDNDIIQKQIIFTFAGLLNKTMKQPPKQPLMCFAILDDDRWTRKTRLWTTRWWKLKWPMTKCYLLDNLCVKYQTAGKLVFLVESKLAKQLKLSRGEADIYNDLTRTPITLKEIAKRRNLSKPAHSLTALN